MTHTPHSLTVSLNYTKQPWEDMQVKNKKKTLKWFGNTPSLDLVSLEVGEICRFWVKCNLFSKCPISLDAKAAGVRAFA